MYTYTYILTSRYPQKQVRAQHPGVSVWSFISEEHLQTKGTLLDEEEEAPMCCGRDGKC